MFFAVIHAREGICDFYGTIRSSAIVRHANNNKTSLHIETKSIHDSTIISMLIQKSEKYSKTQMV